MSWNPKNLEKSLLIGSTLVEGSSLSEREAAKVLQGRTIQGHPISELRELTNYRSAVEWLILQLEASPYLSRDLVLDFHTRLFVGLPGDHGRFKHTSNYTYLSTGQRFDYLKPELVARRFQKWLESFNRASDSLSRKEAIEIGSRLYFEFQFIHPFEDGNGRIGRILMAYWFSWKANLSFSFYLADKIPHLEALEAAGMEQFDLLERFFSKHLRAEKK